MTWSGLLETDQRSMGYCDRELGCLPHSFFSFQPPKNNGYHESRRSSKSDGQPRNLHLLEFLSPLSIFTRFPFSPPSWLLSHLCLHPVKPPFRGRRQIRKRKQGSMHWVLRKVTEHFCIEKHRKNVQLFWPPSRVVQWWERAAFFW